MAGYLIDECVDPAKEEDGGGFITQGLAYAINWLVKPDVKYDDPYPGSTTYLSLLVWNSGTPDEQYNPGDMEDKVSSAVDNAAEQYPEGSPENVNLRRSEAYFLDVKNHMDRGQYDEWWGPVPHRPNFLTVSGTRASGSAEATNSARVPLLNVTTACSRAFQVATNDSRTCIELLTNGAAFGQHGKGHGIANT